MPLETATTISGLNKDWPLNTDQVLQGDDHLRLLKSVLLGQFPGSGGGLDNPVLVTAEEMNFLQGVTSNIQDQLDIALAIEEFPTGTVMTFMQASAPPGWSQVTVSVNNRMLRVTSGAGGGNGGSTLVTDWQGSFTHAHATSSHSLDITEMPAHTHDIALFSGVTNDNVPIKTSGRDNAVSTPGIHVDGAVSTGGGGPHDHGNTDQSNDPAFDPSYLDIILCSKD